MDRPLLATAAMGAMAGLPETFIIDKKGIIRDKHVGPLTADVIERRLAPLIAKLKAE